MKIKLIQTINNPLRFEIETNDFNKNHKVKATQTHITIDPVTQNIIYTAILYYEDSQ